MVLQTEFAQIKNNNLYIDDVKNNRVSKNMEHLYMLCLKDILDINLIN